MINQFLDTVGDGSGTTNAIGDYSDTGAGVEEFFYTDPSGGGLDLPPSYIHRMIVSIGDTTGMQASEYGNTGAALTNGVSIAVKRAAATLIDLTPEPILTNAQWGAYCYDVDLKTWGAGDELLLVRWTFTKSGSPIKLEAGDKLVVTLNDDCSGLTDHRFLIQGEQAWD